MIGLQSTLRTVGAVASTGGAIVASVWNNPVKVLFGAQVARQGFPATRQVIDPLVSTLFSGLIPNSLFDLTQRSTQMMEKGWKQALELGAKFAADPKESIQKLAARVSLINQQEMIAALPTLGLMAAASYTAYVAVRWLKGSSKGAEGTKMDQLVMVIQSLRADQEAKISMGADGSITLRVYTVPYWSRSQMEA